MPDDRPYNLRVLAFAARALQNLAPALLTLAFFARVFPLTRDSARGGSKEPEAIVRLLLFLVMAAAHTTTTTIVHALYDLSSLPEAVFKDLRQEVTDIMNGEEEGWSLQAIFKMKKLDSFLKESQRMNPLGCRE